MSNETDKEFVKAIDKFRGETDTVASESELTDLLCCPFCGGQDVGYAYSKHPDGHELSMISCSTCGASGPVRKYHDSFDDDKSAAAWCKREKKA